MLAGWKAAPFIHSFLVNCGLWPESGIGIHLLPRWYWTPCTWEWFFGRPCSTASRTLSYVYPPLETYFWQCPQLFIYVSPHTLSLRKAVDRGVLRCEETCFVVSLLKRISQRSFSRGLPSPRFSGPPISCSPGAPLLPKWPLSCQSCTFEERGTLFVLTPCKGLLCTVNYCLSLELSLLVAFSCACELSTAWFWKLEDCPHLTT